MHDQCNDPFYVGYLPLPAPIKRFLLPWLVGNFVLALGVVAVIAQQHDDPGDGVWDTGRVVEVQGALIVEPYPLLKTPEGTFILVEQGKIGAQDRVKKLRSGHNYEVSGFVIARAGRQVLEIDGSIEEPIKLIGGDLSVPIGFSFADSSTRIPEFLGTHTLRGEIVDPKCYLGVMQPGDGKTHKTCATLCIRGGIPPMLVVRNDAGETAAYLLTDSEGNAFPESHYEYIADPIELTGRVLRDGGLLILQADLKSIKRLGAGD